MFMRKAKYGGLMVLCVAAFAGVLSCGGGGAHLPGAPTTNLNGNGGTGGGGTTDGINGGTSVDSRLIPVTLDVNWAARSRAVNAPASALSLMVTLARREPMAAMSGLPQTVRTHSRRTQKPTLPTCCRERGT